MHRLETSQGEIFITSHNYHEKGEQLPIGLFSRSETLGDVQALMYDPRTDEKFGQTPFGSPVERVRGWGDFGKFRKALLDGTMLNSEGSYYLGIVLPSTEELFFPFEVIDAGKFLEEIQWQTVHAPIKLVHEHTDPEPMRPLWQLLREEILDAQRNADEQEFDCIFSLPSPETGKLDRVVRPTSVGGVFASVLTIAKRTIKYLGEIEVSARDTKDLLRVQTMVNTPIYEGLNEPRKLDLDFFKPFNPTFLEGVNAQRLTIKYEIRWVDLEPAA